MRGMFAVVIIALVLMPWASPAVDFHPTTKARLQAEGKLPAMIKQYRDAQVRGLDAAEGRNLDLNKMSAAGRGSVINGLIILVDFDDHLADTVNHPPAAFNDLLFSTGTYPTGSMNDYYLENSNQKVGITGTITQWLRMPQLYSYYVDGQAGFGNYPRNAQKLVEDAVAAADPYVDFSQYDNDGDGWVDALFVVHSGPGRESSGSNNDIHSHAWSINAQMRDGVWIQRYSMEPETQGNHMVTMGVFAHEFGHVLGLPDLYDTDYSSSGIGRWSVMSGGSWAGPSGLGGAVPVHFDVWCKQDLGWLTPQWLTTDSLNAAVRPIENDSLAYRVWTNGNGGPEYFLVSYRKKTGFDSYMPAEGMLIWHIDETVPGNSSDWHRKVDLEQADGYFDLNTGANSGDSGDPFPGSSNNTEFTGLTTPNSHNYNDQETLVGIVNIANTGNGAVADLYVAYPLPLVSLQQMAINDSLGDNEGDLDPGEHVWLSVQLDNAGVEAQNVQLSLEHLQGQITLIDSQVTVASIPNGGALLKNVFELQVDPNAADPSYTLLGLTVQNPDFNKHWQEIYSIGDQPGFTSDMENDAWVWQHYPVTSGTDEWHTSLSRNHTPGGMQSYKLGATGAGANYASGQHAALETPWIELNGDMTLEVAMWYSIESSTTPGQAYDGGLVEVTYDGSTYSQITPLEGYTHQIISNPASPFPGGTWVFSGNSSGWQVYHFDFSNASGQARIRFRFGSDAAAEEEGWYIDDVVFTSPTGLEQQASQNVLQSFGLQANYPNPFNPVTTIRYRLAGADRVTLTIYNSMGQLVRTLVDGRQPAGEHSVMWDGRDIRGRTVASGVYLYRLESGSLHQTRKMLLMK